MSKKISKDYCTHLLKYYVGDRGAATRPLTGKDYIYECNLLGERNRSVRENPYKATEMFCKNCPHFDSRNRRDKWAAETNAKIRQKLKNDRKEMI
ncbi:MAG: hypothetical protein LBI03_06255 [Clostridiales bacterium]|jgi:hypothetical protein|nr:hypothetical protein [Clostridiales bacterium]